MGTNYFEGSEHWLTVHVLLSVWIFIFAKCRTMRRNEVTFCRNRWTVLSPLVWRPHRADRCTLRPWKPFDFIFEGFSTFFMRRNFEHPLLPLGFDVVAELLMSSGWRRLWCLQEQRVTWLLSRRWVNVSYTLVKREGSVFEWNDIRKHKHYQTFVGRKEIENIVNLSFRTSSTIQSRSAQRRFWRVLPCDERDQSDPFWPAKSGMMTIKSPRHVDELGFFREEFGSSGDTSIVETYFSL